MTTIVYKENIIAYDSRITQGEIIVSDKYNKLFKKKGVKFIIAGSESDFEKFIDFYFLHKLNKEIPIEEVTSDCQGFVVDNKTLLTAESSVGHGYWVNKCKLNEHWAIGSGSYYALGAMDAGLSAKQALIVAKKRDTSTGGKLRYMKI